MTRLMWTGHLFLLLAAAACGPDANDEPSVPPWAEVAPEQIRAAAASGVPVAFTNSLGMRFVLLPAGTYTMGAAGAVWEWEGPKQRVTIARPFYLSICEVTNAQYREIVPGHDSGAYEGYALNESSQPAASVSWKEAYEFAERLSRRESHRWYRLPNGAEWEYGCQAGTTASYSWGESREVAHRYANGSDPKTKAEFGLTLEAFPADDGYRVAAPVARFLPNRWGLYDMHGNVGEWCWDWRWNEPAEATAGRFGSEAQRKRHRWYRGGSWASGAWFCRAPVRHFTYDDGGPSRTIGFRLLVDTCDPREQVARRADTACEHIDPHMERPDTSPAEQDPWEGVAARMSISELYVGLRLPRQSRLVPLGADPQSNLEEFAVVGTGTVPYRNPVSGQLDREVDFAVVLVLIPGGTYQRGAQSVDPELPNYDPGALCDESPVHVVSLSPFFIAKYECTCAQWMALRREAALSYQDEGDEIAQFPAASVSWYECVKWLAIAGLALPTEAQWEYACRAGSTSPYSSGPHEEDLVRVGWYEKNAGGSTHRGGEKPANALGLHDMHGNVSEWCWDRLVEYGSRSAVDPREAGGGTAGGVLRGGSFIHEATFCRTARRGVVEPHLRLSSIGVRPARGLGP